MKTNKVIFISDVHLGINGQDIEKERERKLVQFLRNSLNPGDRLLIVGDLFDFWFEYKTVIPKEFIHILSCLKEMTENGIRIDYIAGNHDFWVGDFFTKELGIVFHAEPLQEKIGDKSFYIIHGDGLKKADGGYRFLKKVFRSRINIFIYRWLHPDIGVPFAKWCSGSSRKHTTGRDFGGNEEYIEFAEKKFDEGTDFVIMAHTHDPLVHTTDAGKSLVNLGDWISHCTYAEFNGDTLTLKHYTSSVSD